MRKYLWLSIAALIIVGLSVGYITISNTPKPDQIIVDARNWQSEATKNEAMTYAPTEYQKAKMAYDSAMYWWSVENKKMMVQRNFNKVIDFAQLSIEYSQTSISAAQLVSASLKQEITQQLSIVAKAIKTYENNFTKLPASKSRIADFSKSQLLYNQAMMAKKNGQLYEAQHKLDSAAQMIKQVNEAVYSLLKDYFGNQEEWARMAQNCINESSKRKTTTVLVDKYARMCYVYKSGRLIEQFESELGPNWLGDKQQEGDKRTPEGSYQVTKKHDHKKSKYYKALVLNYPNEADKKRFVENQSNGSIPKSKRIGGLIEIHGEGGKGADWTDGCVALNNKDMDRIYSLCEVGTSVVIVGSLDTLKEIIKE